jgi:chromosome transmission fidelity protein 18
MVLYLVPFF